MPLEVESPDDENEKEEKEEDEDEDVRADVKDEGACNALRPGAICNQSSIEATINNSVILVILVINNAVILVIRINGPP